MAASYISVDSTKPLGHSLLQAAGDARRFGEEIAAIKRVMDGMANGTDYAIIEAQFGLPAGKGGDVSYLIAQLKSGLDGLAQFGLLPDWLGQV